MKVFVLKFGFDYEGLEDVKIFSTLEAANLEMMNMSEDEGESYYDFCYVEEMEII